MGTERIADNAAQHRDWLASTLSTSSTLWSRARDFVEQLLDPGFRPQDDADEPVSVTLDSVSAAYGPDLALHGIAGRFEPGSMTAVVGPNGAGKTTLLNLIAGLAEPLSGTVRLDGAGPEKIAYLPQAHAVDRDYPVSVLEFVALGRWRDFGAFRTPPYALLTEAQSALHTVGLHDLAAARVGDLSIGQFRRVLFARVIVQRARLVLLDEPLAALDAATAADLIVVLQAWQQEGRTVIAVLHELDQVRSLFPNALLLARRVIAWGETASVLSPENLAAAGLAIVNRPEPRAGLLRLVPG